MYVNDEDMVSLYPSIMRLLNSSRDCLRSAVFKIDGKQPIEIQDYFSGLISFRENAEPLCVKFHSLPSYEAMGRLFEEELSDAGY